MNFLSYMTSPGSLRIRVEEGTDLADGLPGPLKIIKQTASQSFKLHSIFLTLDILDEHDSVLQTFTSQSQAYQGGGEINFYNEEFFFEQALPTYAIQISTFFCHHVSPGTSADQCAGVMLLPLNRLEENVPVLQWYQLSPADNNERCIKSAIKFEICFFNDSSNTQAQTGSVSPSDTLTLPLPPEPSFTSSASSSVAESVSVDSLRVLPLSSSSPPAPPLPLPLTREASPLPSLRVTIPPSPPSMSPSPPLVLSPQQQKREQSDGIRSSKAPAMDSSCSTASLAPRSSHSNSNDGHISVPNTRSGAHTTPNRILNKSTSLDSHVFSTPTTITADVTTATTAIPRRLTSHIQPRKASTTTHNRHLLRDSSHSLSNCPIWEHLLHPSSDATGSGGGGISDREKNGVRVGVIRHAVLIGPASVECRPPGHTWRDSDSPPPHIPEPEDIPAAMPREFQPDDRKANEGVDDKDRNRTRNSPHHQHDVPLSPSCSPPPLDPAATLQQCADLCIWDQYPPPSLPHHHDHTHSTYPQTELLPEKLEWFAFPNGPKSKASVSRPPPELSSFVLHSDTGELEVSYCVCLTFYLRGDVDREGSFGSKSTTIGGREGPEDWWREGFRDNKISEHCKEGGGAKSPPTSPPRSFSWFAVCLCFISRAPFVTELSDVLLCVYETILEETLLEREALATTVVTSEDRYDQYVQLQLHLYQLLEPLCFEAPMPIPGYMDVAIRLVDLSTTTYAVEDKALKVSASAVVTSNLFLFSLQDVNSFPQCAYSIEYCIHLIGVRSLLDLLYHALSEHKILLHSQDMTILPLVCECVRTILYPLQWSSVYIPTVPSLLLDLVEAPVPFILGISSSNLAWVDPAALSSLVRVDCDTGRVFTGTGTNTGNSSGTGGSGAPPCCFSPALDRWCVVALKSALEADFRGEEGVNDAAEIGCTSRGEEGSGSSRTSHSSVPFSCEKNIVLQAIVFDCLLSMLCYLPDCVYNVTSGFPQLNVDMLLDGYSPPSAAPFLRALCSTQAFHRCVSQLHRPDMAMFLQCAARLRHVFHVGTHVAASTSSFFSSHMFPLEQARFYQEGDRSEEGKQIKQREKSLRKRMVPPYFNPKNIASTEDAAARGGGEGGDSEQPDVFPPWVYLAFSSEGARAGGGTELHVQSCVFQVLCRYQELLGCFNGLSPVFTPSRTRAMYTVDISCTRVAPLKASSTKDGDTEKDTSINEHNTNVAIFPPLCFAEKIASDRQRYWQHWKLDEIMRKLKKQYAAPDADEPLRSADVHMWKRLFRLLTTCKVNQKLHQHQRQREAKATENLLLSSSMDREGSTIAVSHPPSLPSPPASPSDHTVKKLHYEYMFGSDDITRLVLKILPVRHSDSLLDEELVAKLQFESPERGAGEAVSGSQQRGGGLFAQGDARRRVIRALKGYAKQLVITFLPSSVYQQQYQEANKKHMTLPSKRLQSIVDSHPVELHVIAFGYLHQLFKQLLQACAEHKDYLTAYGALEMAGYFYQVHLPDAKLSNNSTTLNMKQHQSGESVTSAPCKVSPISSSTVTGILKHRGHGMRPPPLSPARSSSPGVYTPERRRHHQQQEQAQGQGGGFLVQSLRSRICHDPLFSNMSLWQIVMNDVMSSHYMPVSPPAANKEEGRGSNQEKESPMSVYDVVKPVLIHMMECNISLVKINELLESIVVNFEIRDTVEVNKLMERFKLMWQVGRESIRAAVGDIVGSGIDAGREEKLLLVRRLLHSTQEHAQLLHSSTPKFVDSPISMNSTRVSSRSFDFSSVALGSPPPHLPSLSLGPQFSAIGVMNRFDNDALFVTDEEDGDGDDEGRYSHNMFEKDSLYLTDTDTDVSPPPPPPRSGALRFSFAGQPRHESSLGSATKQLTSMHMSCVTSVDIALSSFDYVLHSPSSSNHVSGKEAHMDTLHSTTPVLALSHHLVSGDAEGNVFVTNFSSSSPRTHLLGRQKHPAPILACRGLPNDYVASACSSGELRIWNLVAEGRGRSRSSTDPSSSLGGRNTPSRKAAVCIHKPFTSTASRGGGGAGISCMALAESGGVAVAAQWSDEDNKQQAEELSDSSSWLLAVGGVRGGLKVYHGDTAHAHLAGGREVCSAESPDYSRISCLHLLGGVGGSLRADPLHSSSSSSSAVQSSIFNNLLKYSVNSRIQSLLSSPQPPPSATPSPSSGYLFVGSSRGTVTIFDLSSSASAQDACVFRSPQVSSHSALVSGVVPVSSSGGKHLVSGGYDRLVKFWDVRISGRDSCCLDLEGAGGAVTHVAMDETNPHRVLGVSSDGVVRLWDMRFVQQYTNRSSEPYMAFHTGHVDRICDVMQTAGLLLTASRDGTVFAWDFNTGQCVQTLSCDTSRVMDGYASKGAKTGGDRTGHASLSCTRLLRTPLPLPLLQSAATAVVDTSDDEDSRCGQGDKRMRGGVVTRTSGRTNTGVHSQEQPEAVGPLLVTGDYGGTVKVWRGSRGQAAVRRAGSKE